MSGRSNHLSYKPAPGPAARHERRSSGRRLTLRRSHSCKASRQATLLRKEVIQPHLPVRLPCYDLAPVASLTLKTGPPKVSLASSGTADFHRLTGGVYKARERIHRGIADPRLLAIPPSRSRVAETDPNWERRWRLASPRGVATLCTVHCSTCAAPGVRAILT